MAAAVELKHRYRQGLSVIRDVLSPAFGQFTLAGLSVFHEFDFPPAGGGYQFHKHVLIIHQH